MGMIAAQNHVSEALTTDKQYQRRVEYDAWMTYPP